MKNSSDTVGNQTRNLLACSTFPQPTASPHAPEQKLYFLEFAYHFVGLQWDRAVLSDTYTGCPRRNVPDFRRVFLMLKYTDITQNTYVQS